MLIDDFSGRYISKIGATIMSSFDVLINLLIDVGSAFAKPIGGAIASYVLGKWVDYLSTREKAEYLAYNWYYLFFFKRGDF